MKLKNLTKVDVSKLPLSKQIALGVKPARKPVRQGVFKNGKGK